MSCVVIFAAVLVALAARSPRKISIDGSAAIVSFSSDFFGSVKFRITELPCCLAAKSVTGLGTTGRGGVGTPGAPHAAMHTHTSSVEKNICCRRKAGAARMPDKLLTGSQDVAAQILILHNFGQLLAHVCRINFHDLALHVRRFK